MRIPHDGRARMGTFSPLPCTTALHSATNAIGASDGRRLTLTLFGHTGSCRCAAAAAIHPALSDCRAMWFLPHAGQPEAGSAIEGGAAPGMGRSASR